jgi:hypothetical protein
MNGDPQRGRSHDDLDREDPAMSPVQTATAPVRCAETDGRPSRKGMRKLTETLPIVITDACHPVESEIIATVRSTQ